MKRHSKKKPISQLSPAELDALSEEFDREFVVDTFGPLPRSVKNRLDRAKRKPGRPRIGAGSQAISVTIEKKLLQRIDQVARRRKTTRAQLIARGLRTVLQEEQLAAAR
ncbi:MAG TPA: hypothetical protein PLL20_18195 [Phycisphaerae bacterium]|jgi:hypothetical protein|nr:hypothetical protein [Phycisphaerae bacterium]HRR85287.1 hypothetical protein [Phycisphaerae bacterium]